MFRFRASPCLVLFAFLLVCCSTSFAQSLTPQQQAFCDSRGEHDRCLALVNEFYFSHELLSANPHSTLDFPPGDTKAFVAKIAPRALLIQLTTDLKAKSEQASQTALQTISTTAAVTQVGGSASTSGSTNLVAKPTVTDFISLAAESGAFTDTQNGNALTLQANALGLTKYFSNLPIFERLDSRLADRVQPLTVTVSMNVAQSSSSSLNTTGIANSAKPVSLASVILPSNNASLSSVGATYNIHRRYNPQDKTFLENWKSALANNKFALASTGSAIAAAVNSLFTPDAKGSPSPFMQQVDANMSSPLSEWRKSGAAAESAVISTNSLLPTQPMTMHSVTTSCLDRTLRRTCWLFPKQS